MIYLAGGGPEEVSNAWAWARGLTSGSWEGTNIQSDNQKCSDALGITEHNGKIFVVGYQKEGDETTRKPYLWTGSSLQNLSPTVLPTPGEPDSPYDEPYPYSISCYNGQPYIAGHYTVRLNEEDYYRAALWVETNNPQLYVSEDGNDSAAFSVFVYKGDVYVAGNVKKPKTANPEEAYVQPCYWKNGERVDLSIPSEEGVSVSEKGNISACTITVY